MRVYSHSTVALAGVCHVFELGVQGTLGHGLVRGLATGLGSLVLGEHGREFIFEIGVGLVGGGGGEVGLVLIFGIGSGELLAHAGLGLGLPDHVADVASEGVVSVHADAGQDALHALAALGADEARGHLGSLTLELGALALELDQGLLGLVDVHAEALDVGLEGGDVLLDLLDLGQLGPANLHVFLVGSVSLGGIGASQLLGTRERGALGTLGDLLLAGELCPAALERGPLLLLLVDQCAHSLLGLEVGPGELLAFGSVGCGDGMLVLHGELVGLVHAAGDLEQEDGPASFDGIEDTHIVSLCLSFDVIGSWGCLELPVQAAVEVDDYDSRY